MPSSYKPYISLPRNRKADIRGTCRYCKYAELLADEMCRPADDSAQMLQRSLYR